MAIDDPLAELHGHLMSLRDGQIQFCGDLLIRQVEPQEVRTQHPHPQRLMVPGKHRPGQIVEATLTPVATITLSAGLACYIETRHY